MAKQIAKRSFNDVLALLGTQRFDVGGAQEGAGKTQGAVRVSKLGCAAEIATAGKVGVMMLAKPGWVLNGQISRLVDKGYQKFLRAGTLEIPATAAHLRAIHEFSQELDAVTGEIDLYNEALGTTSDVYLYDRVAGRADSGR